MVFPNERVVSRESNKFVPHTFHTIPSEGCENLKNIKANLQKLTTCPLIDRKTPKKGLVQLPGNNKSTNNLLIEHSLMHSPSYTNLHHPSKAKIIYNYAPITPPAQTFNKKQHEPK